MIVLVIDMSYVDSMAAEHLLPDEKEDIHGHRKWDRSTWNHVYYRGIREPRYPVPAIPLQVKYDYVGCVNVDDVADPDDPVVVYLYDSWNKTNHPCIKRAMGGSDRGITHAI